MHEFADWSVGLGRWKSVPVRIHLSFVLFSILLLVLASTGRTFEISYTSSLAVVVLLLAVALHELGHVIVACRLGGQIREIVIGPVGGLAYPSLSGAPQSHLLVAVAGPLSNLVLAAVLAGVLAVLHGEPLTGLLHPFLPQNVIEGPSWLVALRLGVWLNWLLFLVNLLPVYPFDGAIIYCSALRPWLGGRTAAIYVSRAGFVFALVLLGWAWWWRDSEPAGLTPAWLPPVVGAVFLAFSAQRDCRRHNSSNWEGVSKCGSGDELSEDPIEFEEDPYYREESAEDSWREGNLVEAGAWRSSDDDVEEARLDDVLAKLHHSGIEALSIEDRQLLERASQRYRSRRQNRSTEDA